MKDRAKKIRMKRSKICIIVRTYRDYSMLCGDLNGKEIQKRGDICIRIADSLCCTVETNTTL